MAPYRVLPAFFLLLLVLAEGSSAPSPAAAAAAAAMNCGGACAVRCSRSWKPKMCLKMCMVCCGRCNCVPPGTGADTRALCPCYANMKNPKGKYKCP